MSDDDPRLSALYRRAPLTEPGADSDDAILRAARAAAARRPRRSLVPWAVAATLVLGVGIGWRVMQFPAPTGVSVLPPSAPASLESRIERVPMPAPAPQDRTRKNSSAGAPFGKPRNGQALEPSHAQRERESTPLNLPLNPMLQKRTVDGVGMKQADEAAAATRPTAPSVSGCAAHWLPDGATEAQWQAAVMRAHLADDPAVLQCLQVRYREMFDKPPPDPVSKPAPDK